MCESSNKIILTDVDGVLLDWVSMFTTWMYERGFRVNPDKHHLYTIGDWYGLSDEEIMPIVREFNGSAAIGFFSPLPKAKEYVQIIHHTYGYRFHAITSMGTCKYAKRLREENLKSIFGDEVFTKFIFFDVNHCKKDALKLYAPGTIWVEDKPENAVVGHQLGLRSVLMNHGHNTGYPIPKEIPRADTWEDIYHIIRKEHR